jgi:iron complex transport system permease protein
VSLLPADRRQSATVVAANVQSAATARHARWTWHRPLLGLTALLLLALVVSLFIGRFPDPYWMPPALLQENELARQLVFNLRLPRILTAVLLGMSLGGAGAVMQMIFRNPLVEPGFLGVSQGAGFGAALAIIKISNAPLVIEFSATVFAFLGLAISYWLARNLNYGSWVLRLVLAGIAVSALFSSGVGLLKYVADPLKQLPEITFWLLGGLWSVTWTELLYILPLVVPALGILWLMRWRLNLLSLSDETAFSLGISAGRERTMVLVASVSATAAVVAVAGIVGSIGLIVPHIARRWMGTDAQYSLPASMLIGGIFALLCDDIARTLYFGEIPLGILTSLIGAIAFAVMLSQRQRFKA